MGYVIDRFLIVYQHYTASIESAHAMAVERFGALVGPVMKSTVNDTHGFTVWSSGSKVGWVDDETHQARLDEYIADLSKMDAPPKWIRVNCGEDGDELDASSGYDGDYVHRYKVRTARTGR